MNTRHDEDYNFVFKIILLGDSSVGKTHLLSRYIRGQLPRSKFPTIGVEFATKPVPLKTGGTVRVQIWDTAGQEKYHSLAPMYYRGAQAAIVVYDVTNPDTFARAKTWVKELVIKASPNLLILLVGKHFLISLSSDSMGLL